MFRRLYHGAEDFPCTADMWWAHRLSESEPKTAQGCAQLYFKGVQKRNDPVLLEIEHQTTFGTKKKKRNGTKQIILIIFISAFKIEHEGPWKK